MHHSDITQPRFNFLVSLPYLVTAVVIALIWSWYLIDLGAGHLWHYDEFYTYDRSTGFARNGDWLSVYSNNEPSLKKPPLQYWLSGALMEFGMPDILALRLLSMVFALGALVATALLARIMIPETTWAMLPSVVLVASSLQFWRYATSAMLDTGAVFFTTLSITAMFAAFERPKYWPFFGVTVFLAAMQKSPTPLAFLAMALVALVLTRKWQPLSPRDIWQSKTFRRTLLISLLLAFSWPIFQQLRFVLEGSLDGSTKRQMLDRFTPSISGRGLEDLYGLIFGGEPWLRLAGFVGLCVLPLTQRRLVLFAAAGIALLFVVMMWAASGRVFARYTLLILPLLMVGAAGFVLSLGRLRWLGLGVLLALVVVAGGPFHDRVKVRFGGGIFRFGIPLSDILLPLGEQLQPHETLVICATNKKGPRVPPGAASVYASDGQRFVYLSRPELAKYLQQIGYSSGPLRGFCGTDELAQLASELTGLATSPAPVDGFVYWTATGIREVPD